MIIQLKAAPELGRLKVVSDKFEEVGCEPCSLKVTDKCGLAVRSGFDCIKHDVHFEQVKLNDQQT